MVLYPAPFFYFVFCQSDLQLSCSDMKLNHFTVPSSVIFVDILMIESYWFEQLFSVFSPTLNNLLLV